MIMIAFIIFIRATEGGEEACRHAAIISQLLVDQTHGGMHVEVHPVRKARVLCMALVSTR